MSCPGPRPGQRRLTPWFLTGLGYDMKKKIVLHFSTTERIRKEEIKEGKGRRGRKGTQEATVFSSSFLFLTKALYWGHSPGRTCPPEHLTEGTSSECLQGTVTDWALSPRPEFKPNAEQISQGLGSD